MDWILIDSCVLLDLFTDDPNWADWSENVLDKYSHTNTLSINSVIYRNFNRLQKNRRT